MHAARVHNIFLVQHDQQITTPYELVYSELTDYKDFLFLLILVTVRIVRLQPVTSHNAKFEFIIDNLK